MTTAERASGNSRLVNASVIATVLAILTLGSSPAAAITFGQVDDFEDGLQGWTRGSFAITDPLNISDGGPDGAGDGYLQISTDSTGFARLTSNNIDAQWAGDWTAAGVTGIQMDVRNFGNTDLYLRLGISTGGANDASDAFATNYYNFLAAGSDWTTITFSVTPSDWIAASGGPNTIPGTDIDATLAGVTQLRIFSSITDGAFRGDVITATLGVDNITAVPLPAAFWLFGSGLFGLISLTRSRKTA